MAYELFIGLRYLKAKRKQTFISVITFISILGITVGVTALIIVLSVMTGFEENLREKILGISANVVVTELGAPMKGYREVSSRVSAQKNRSMAKPVLRPARAEYLRPRRSMRKRRGAASARVANSRPAASHRRSSSARVGLVPRRSTAMTSTGPRLKPSEAPSAPAQPAARPARSSGMLGPPGGVN